jgi:hypothetical protein
MTITVLHHDDRNDPTQAPIDVHLKKNTILDHNTIKLAIKEALGDLEERDVARVWQARKTADGLIKRNDDIANMTAEYLKNVIHLGAENREPFLWYNKNASPPSSPRSSPSNGLLPIIAHDLLRLSLPLNKLFGSTNPSCNWNCDVCRNFI